MALLLVMAVMIAGPEFKGTYKGTISGADVTLQASGDKGTMTSEVSFLGLKSSGKERFTVDKDAKMIYLENDEEYHYILMKDKVILSTEETGDAMILAKGK